ncbi:alpha-mannosidase [Sesbania bispinosa]|nr:alpha-mannosidase [Sesbania bispinosa]
MVAIKPPAAVSLLRTHPHRAQLCELHLLATNHPLTTLSCASFRNENTGREEEGNRGKFMAE